MHIVFSIVLMTLLSFVQLGANYFHHDHCHKLSSNNKSNGVQIEKKSEDCSICNLHLNHSLYYQDFDNPTFIVQKEQSFFAACILKTSHFSFEATGRAPPLS